MNLLKRNPLRSRLVCGLAIGITAISVGTIATLSGCGGGSHDSSTSATNSTGRATIVFTFPAATSRLVPVASNSIVVRFLQGTTVVSSQTLTRPSSGNTATATFNSLPVGNLTVSATAYPASDGTGTAQASATTAATITSGSNTTVNLTMGSTIDHLSNTPTSPSVAVGSTTALTASAIDASGNVVLTSSSTITWVSQHTSVATVDSSGIVTGVSVDTANIVAAESESGKTATVSVSVTTAPTPSPSPSPSSSPSPSPSPSTGTTIVDLANAYIATLSTTQQSATVAANSATNAAKWTILPAAPTSSGTTSSRNGISYSYLTTAQKSAWTTLVNAVLAINSSTQPLNQYNQIRAADNYLGTLNNGYSGDYQYVAFVGTPSTTGSWMIQILGHHIAHNYYFTGNTLNTTTPYFLGVEPTSFTYSGTSYTPLSAQRTGMYNMINSLTSAQLTSAKLSSNFSDVLLGPGKDARSNFPTSGRGLLISSLSSDQKALVKTAIAAWVNNSPLASTYQSLYESELDQTYVAYSGNAALSTQGDYVRIDGPHVWIEFVCQNGIVIQNQIHYHTIWRDRVTDYNAAYGF